MNNLLSSFSTTDLNEIHNAVNYSFKMDWMKISNCIEHELYPKLASTIRAIINKQNNKNNNKKKKQLKYDYKHVNIRVDDLKEETFVLDIIRRERNLGIFGYINNTS